LPWNRDPWRIWRDREGRAFQFYLGRGRVEHTGGENHPNYLVKQLVDILTLCGREGDVQEKNTVERKW